MENPHEFQERLMVLILQLGDWFEQEIVHVLLSGINHQLTPAQMALYESFEDAVSIHSQIMGLFALANEIDPHHAEAFARSWDGHQYTEG